MIINEHFVQQIQGIFIAQMFIFTIDEFFPTFFLVTKKNFKKIFFTVLGFCALADPVLYRICPDSRKDHLCPSLDLFLQADEGYPFPRTNDRF